jgi:hypothetical protein
MGFAYAQGIIDALKNSSYKDQIRWGGYRAAIRYIIAPENGCAGTVNPNDWEQIWQYGSDLDRPDKENADKMWEQDGVAPQCGVNGLDDQRAYIPKNLETPKGFLESHSISNYGWIFDQIPGSNGYVTPR